MSRPNKIALIGARGYNQRTDRSVVTCFPWDKLHRNHNLKDYDEIVFNLLSLRRNEKVNWTVFDEVWNVGVALAVLGNAGRVYVLGDPRFEISVETDTAGDPETTPHRPASIPFLDWTGMQFTWLDESGDSMVAKGILRAYENYLAKLSSWKYCLAQCRLADAPWEGLFKKETPDGAKLTVEAKVNPFLTTRYDRAIAFRVYPVLKVHRPISFRSGYHVSEESIQGFGSIVFLPEVDLTEDEAITTILRDVLQAETNLPEPGWVNHLVAPGQQEVDQDLERRRIQIEAALEEFKARQEDRSRAREPLRLLYDEGNSLESTVRKVLRSLGGDVEDPDPNEPAKEDGWLTIEMDVRLFEGVLEIKGTRNDQFNEMGLKQLAEWQERGQRLRHKTYKRLFIGNAGREKPIKERRWPFADGWKKTAELQDVCAIRTEDLYTIYELREAGSLDVDAFWRQLFRTTGVFDMTSYRQ